jgi:hypothetical protein
MPTRNLRPRPAVAVAPLAVSTENSLAVAGVPPRRLRELLAAHPEVPRARAGHLTIVTAEDFFALLERLRVVDESAGPASTDEGDGAQPETVDGVLRALGKERAHA